MFRGFATLSFYADDLAAAKDWYTELLGVEPYYAFPEPPAPTAYLEFRIGDDEDEFGFIDRKYAPSGAANPPRRRGDVLARRRPHLYRGATAGDGRH